MNRAQKRKKVIKENWINNMKKNSKDLEKEITSSEMPVLAEFWGSWCLPCQMMDPTLKELEKEYQDKIKILKINSDTNPTVSSKYDIRGVPTFILFRKGKEIKREIGAKSKEELCKIIDDFLENEEK